MNINSNSVLQGSYTSQLQNNTAIQSQSAQSGFSPEGMREANEGNDHDGDDGVKQNANNALALNQLLSKQKNSIFPTSNQSAGLKSFLLNQQDLQQLLVKNIESSYGSLANNYANNTLSSLSSGINLKA